jgi:hypothetical protein
MVAGAVVFAAAAITAIVVGVLVRVITGSDLLGTASAVLSGYLVGDLYVRRRLGA